MSKTSDSKKGRFNGRGHLFTSESVTMGHPDKVADQISDAILDAVLEQDPNSRVACETLVATGMAVIAGEITTAAEVSIPDIVRSTIKEIGYTDPAIGFDADNCAVLVALGRQSPDISQGVTEGKGLHKEQGAGDQGLMFGFACKETPDLMPMPIYLAHKLTDRLAKMRQSGKMPWLRPDGKSQVTVEYGDDGKPKRIHTVVISTQHTEDISYREIKKQVIENIILPVLPAKLVDKKLICHVNPTGRFVTGGPKGDSGLPDARSSSIPTADAAVTAAAPLAAKTRPRWIARPAIWPAISPRTSSPPAWPMPARCSCPTPSAWPTPSASLSIPKTQARSKRYLSKIWCASSSP